MSKKSKNLEDAARGCLLGALVGDAAGAVLEFKGKVTLEECDRAMNMPGGGVLRVAPGQITDDGELTLSLARALIESDTFDIEKIALNYARWIDSLPFDLGNTTASSLGSHSEGRWQKLRETEGVAAVMMEAAKERCTGSKANGSLMRITPLGIWGHQFSDEELASYAMQDSRLSHLNPTCCYAVACYTIAISSLMRDLGDSLLAFDRARNWLAKQGDRSLSLQQSRGYEEVSGWLEDAAKNVNIPYYPHSGFIKIAFTHAFRHLHLQTHYEEAILETLRGSGDTDTNACIVGGLIGSLWGENNIPDRMKNPVLNCDTKLGRPRPDFLSSKFVPQIVQGLLASKSKKTEDEIL
ncbi:MAG: ADP-ribosylglycohydrolase family protein [Cyanobacteria bacterium SBLK]|nr:ADP-ribosylglycohydrolase family protein [Cyanobacteria bacterium SBLK]